MSCALEKIVHDSSVDYDALKPIERQHFTKGKIPFFSFYQSYDELSGDKWMTSYKLNGQPVYYIRQYKIKRNEHAAGGSNCNPIFLPHLWNTKLDSVAQLTDFDKKGKLTVYSQKPDGSFTNLDLMSKETFGTTEYNYNDKKHYIIHTDGRLSEGFPIPDSIVSGTRLFMTFKWSDVNTTEVIDPNETFYGIYDFVSSDKTPMFKIENHDGGIYLPNFEYTTDFEDQFVKNKVTESDKTEICQALKQFMAHVNPSLLKVDDLIEHDGNPGYIIDVSKADSGNYKIKYMDGVEKDDVPINEIAILDDIEKKYTDNFTPLHIASKYNVVHGVQLLLSKGANIESEAELNETPLHLASWFNSVDVVKLLLSNNANVNAQNSLGKTPLYIASANKYADIVKLLLEKGADKNIPYNNKTPLQVATENKYADVIALLEDPKTETVVAVSEVAKEPSSNPVFVAVSEVASSNPVFVAVSEVAISTISSNQFMKVSFKGIIPEEVELVEKIPDTYSSKGSLHEYIQTELLSVLRDVDHTEYFQLSEDEQKQMADIVAEAIQEKP